VCVWVCACTTHFSTLFKCILQTNIQVLFAQTHNHFSPTITNRIVAHTRIFYTLIHLYPLHKLHTRGHPNVPLCSCVYKAFHVSIKTRHVIEQYKLPMFSGSVPNAQPFLKQPWARLLRLYKSYLFAGNTSFI